VKFAYSPKRDLRSLMRFMSIKEILPELIELEELANKYRGMLNVEMLGEISHGAYRFPIYGMNLGSQHPEAPVFGLFGGVHGLERIGTHVLLSFLKTLLYRMEWEKDWQTFFTHCRLVTIPIINPMGMALIRRGNGNNVDLMRNAPVEAHGKLIPLVSGHRVSPLLPWYRGEEGKLELESQVVHDFCEKHIFRSKTAITLDLHSGFGFKDRLWYPWANSLNPFPLEKEVLNLKKLLEETYPYHIYTVEHQSLNYSNHGDLWDWIYQSYQKANPEGRLLPLTLEMGSWLWVKKNLWQVFSWEGLFNPVKKHRYARTMRRHNQLLELLMKASLYNESWRKVE
jgi:Zinc carboxypeptidase